MSPCPWPCNHQVVEEVGSVGIVAAAGCCPEAVVIGKNLGESVGGDVKSLVSGVAAITKERADNVGRGLASDGLGKSLGRHSPLLGTIDIGICIRILRGDRRVAVSEDLSRDLGHRRLLVGGIVMAGAKIGSDQRKLTEPLHELKIVPSPEGKSLSLPAGPLLVCNFSRGAVYVGDEDIAFAHTLEELPPRIAVKVVGGEVA